MSHFEDCKRLCEDRRQLEEEEEDTPIRVPITVVGTSLAIVVQCEECSKKKNLCKKDKKCDKC